MPAVGWGFKDSDCTFPKPEAGSQKSSCYDTTPCPLEPGNLQRPPSAITLLALYLLPIVTNMDFSFLLGFNGLIVYFYYFYPYNNNVVAL